ncbi:MAG: hypothetical protein IKX09_02920, partial [Oscillospiraceae bacterium]|nr:hypothetical protein [Oscillospiraceae bacterium]
MGKKVVIVIGDRLGKGQKVAAGVETAGGEAYTIPGMAADMKLGEVMKEKGADLGISFCGSGGAGALMAANKYKYTCRYGMRSIDEGVTAVKRRNRQHVDKAQRNGKEGGEQPEFLPVPSVGEDVADADEATYLTRTFLCEDVLHLVRIAG